MIRLVIWIAVMALSAVSDLGPAGSAAAVTPVPALVTTYDVPGSLNGVAATSSDNAWAVGAANGKPLILHWNGTKWSPVKVAGVGSGNLLAITAVSATDVWAVGLAPHTGHIYQVPLILHWNGKAWHREAIVPVGTFGAATAVAATTREVWVAVPNTGVMQFLHLIGGRWYVVPAIQPPNLSLYPNSLTIVTSKLAWAGGTYDASNGSPHAFLMRWNGSVWKTVSSPPTEAFASIEGMAAGPGGAAWAVGYGNETVEGGSTRTMHWNGNSWQLEPAPIPDSGGFNAVGFIPGGTAWAVGWSLTGPPCTLIARWSGSAWTPVRTSGPTVCELAGVAATSPRNAWAVGYSFDTDLNTRTMILHWNGAAWN